MSYDNEQFCPSAQQPENAAVRRHARISKDGLYRYALWREWRTALERPRWATFVMLNPSTADAEVDDPTIRRCIGFAKSLGCTGLAVVNLYALRSTSPDALWVADDPVGPENDATLAEFLGMSARYHGPLIAAWGAKAKADRVREVLALPGADRLLALGTTKDGAPRHPLYLRADSRPVCWPERHPCGHPEATKGCGGCDPGAVEFVITDDGQRRPFDAARDMSTSPGGEA